MKISKVFLICGFTVIFSSTNASDEVKFSSSAQQSVMIELFTSQGCSSCPPAENWLNSYIDDRKLWHEIIPIAFHVDYWDRLGWPDPYANHAHSMRQYRHQQQRHVRSVYTPGVLVNGQEWRGWIRGNDFPNLNTDAGILSFEADQNKLQVKYSKLSKDHVLNVVLLGVDITTRVERGENRGKNLKQNFVVLSHDMYSASKSDKTGKWTLPLPKDISNNVQRHALALWVSDIDDISPIQATGYWLPSRWVVATN